MGSLGFFASAGLTLGVDSLLVDDLPTVIAIGNIEGGVLVGGFYSGVFNNSAPTDDAVGL